MARPIILDTHIPVTQYHLPNGRRSLEYIERDEDIAAKAFEIIHAGYKFETEVLTTGVVSMTITDDQADVDIELCNNGPEVPVHFDKMVNRFYEKTFQKEASK